MGSVSDDVAFAACLMAALLLPFVFIRLFTGGWILCLVLYVAYIYLAFNISEPVLTYLLAMMLGAVIFRIYQRVLC